MTSSIGLHLSEGIKRSDFSNLLLAIVCDRTSDRSFQFKPIFQNAIGWLTIGSGWLMSAIDLLVSALSSFLKLYARVYICAYTKRMSYQWDPEKASSNRIKHGIDFADAVTVLEDDFAITIEDQRYDEERFITIGIDAIGQILVVVYTWRGNEIRLISARKADRSERQQYLKR